MYVRYIQLAQPNVWTFEFDPETHGFKITSTDPELLIIGFDEGQLLDNGDGTYTPRESCYDKSVETYKVLDNNLLQIQPMYKTYNDENNTQKTDGYAVFAKHPGVPDAISGTDYSDLYLPKEQEKPLAPEQPNMALLVGYDAENHGLILSNKATTPSGYLDGTVAPYGKGTKDNVQRSILTYDANAHNATIGVFNVGRVPIMNVQQEGL